MSTWATGLTSKGRALQAKAQAGATLVYTRIAIGDGNLGGQSITALTALISQKMTMDITALYRPTGSTRAVIGTVIKNANVAEGFFFREFGIFATDPDAGEILYFYGNAADTADYIPPDGSDIVEKSFNVNVFVGEAANITANIDSSLVYASQQDLVDGIQEAKDYTDQAVQNATIPDATLTTKGKTQLNSATDSPSETESATPKAVKTVNDALTAHLADGVNHVPYAADTGTANAKAVTLNPEPTAYVEGMAVSFKNKTDNTGAVTINVNALGAKAILKSNGNALSSGNLKANSIYTLRYNGTAFILQGEGGSGNLQPNQALAGFTFTNDNGEQVGIGDANLIPANIISGKSIFGVIGALDPTAKYATGTLTTGTYGSNQYPFTLTGLSFTPKLLLIEVSFQKSSVDTAQALSLAACGFFTRQALIAITISGSFRNDTVDISMTANSGGANGGIVTRFDTGSGPFYSGSGTKSYKYYAIG